MRSVSYKKSLVYSLRIVEVGEYNFYLRLLLLNILIFKNNYVISLILQIQSICLDILVLILMLAENNTPHLAYGTIWQAQ